ncbi:MAG: hypothetical protein ACHP65_04200 [Legionellales bacterium]
MLRKIGFTLLCASALISTNVYSISSHAIQPGLTLEFTFPANDPQFFYNFTFGSIAANCKIATEDASNILFIEAVARKGEVNGVPLLEGQSVSVNVHAGDNVKIGADSGAKVKITNFGPHNIKATCST